MATAPDLVINSGYVKRIAFLDGQVLHDFHLNYMQRNFAEALKRKTTQERYDIYLMVSPYNLYFMESFVDQVYRDAILSTDAWNSLEFSNASGSWVSTLLELPDATNEINLVANYEDYPEQGATVEFFYRHSPEEQWQPILPDEPVYLSVPKKYMQIKVECNYTGTIRPRIFDYALLWK